MYLGTYCCRALSVDELNQPNEANIITSSKFNNELWYFINIHN